MNPFCINNVKLVGIASAVPEKFRVLEDDIQAFPEADVAKISETTGVKKRHIVGDNLCASDLCFAAAERLLTESQLEKESIDTLIFISQTPDYILPSTACSLHARLQLTKSCRAFDINLGCSGYVYGLWIASSLISSGGAKRVLLLAGDTISKITNPQDRSSALLFGDAGTATILEYHENTEPLSFVLGTDGKGSQNLIVPAGGFRLHESATTALSTVREDGNVRSDNDLYMNGTEVFSFTLREVPRMVKALINDMSNIDAVVMHQANKFIINFIAKKLKIPPQKIKLSISKFGNTSSASIPITISDTLSEKLKESSQNLLLVGFGVGFSWGAVSLTCGPIVIPDIVYISETKNVSSVV